VAEIIEKEILQELQRISKLLALDITKEMAQRDKIETLSNIGLQPKEIADLIGTTPGTVSVALVQIRKNTKIGKRKLQKHLMEAASND
jgi:CRP-like cAMP-binding protein